MKTNKQVYNWLKRYTHDFKNEYYMGLCERTAERLIEYLNDDYELWELWEGKTDSFWHVAIKYNNYYWDGSGKHKTLDAITKHYKKCENPYWHKASKRTKK